MKVRFLPLLLCWLVACQAPVNPLADATGDQDCATRFRDNSIDLSKELDALRPRLDTATAVTVLEDGAAAMLSRAWLCEYAQKSIDVQYFIFSTDNVGLIACDYLVRAADRGVKVRILVDDLMVDADPEDLLTMAAHENIEVKIYNPGVNLGKNLMQRVQAFATDYSGSNQRMHTKAFIVDDRVVITGGRNVADEYFDFDQRYNFRDRDVLLMGPVVREVKSSFNTFWQHEICVNANQVVTPKDTVEVNFDKLHAYACDSSNFWPGVRRRLKDLPGIFKGFLKNGDVVWLDSIEYVADRPGKNELGGLHGGGTTTDKLMALVAEARYTVDIQSPYLITTEQGRSLFKAAVDRGVRVRILTNSLGSTDNLEAFGGYARDRELLLATGVEVYEYKPDAIERYEVMSGALQDSLEYAPIFGLHAKTMVVDGHISVVGTFNLDPRSANLNTECITVMHSDQIARQITEKMEISYSDENAWQTTVDFNPDSTSSKGRQFNAWTRRVIPKNIL